MRGKSFRKKVSSASVTRTYPRERRQRGNNTGSSLPRRAPATGSVKRPSPGRVATSETLLKAVTPAGRSFQKPNRFIRRFHLDPDAISP